MAAGPGTASPAEWDGPARRLRDAIEPLAMASVWTGPVIERFAALGLDRRTAYVRGRSAVLGDVVPSVVVATFGVFEPATLTETYEVARGACTAPEALLLREEGVVEALATVLGEPDELEDVVAALRAATAAIDPMGRPLTAGELGAAWPEHPLGQLWHACAILRELRGDGHLTACAVAGLTGLEANLLTEIAIGWDPFAYTATRGWSTDAMAASLGGLEDEGLVADEHLTDAGQRLRASLEEATDRTVDRAITAMGDALDDVVATTTRWSQALIDHGWFPSDPRKRAAG